MLTRISCFLVNVRKALSPLHPMPQTFSWDIHFITPIIFQYFLLSEMNKNLSRTKRFYLLCYLSKLVSFFFKVQGPFLTQTPRISFSME